MICLFLPSIVFVFSPFCRRPFYPNLNLPSWYVVLFPLSIAPLPHVPSAASCTSRSQWSHRCTLRYAPGWHTSSSLTHRGMTQLHHASDAACQHNCCVLHSTLYSQVKLNSCPSQPLRWLVSACSFWIRRLKPSCNTATFSWRMRPVVTKRS